MIVMDCTRYEYEIGNEIVPFNAVDVPFNVTVVPVKYHGEFAVEGAKTKEIT